MLTTFRQTNPPMAHARYTGGLSCARVMWLAAGLLLVALALHVVREGISWIDPLMLMGLALPLAAAAVVSDQPDDSRREERIRAFMQASTEAIWCFELEQPIRIDLPEDQQIELCYQHAHLADCNETMARMYGFESAQQMRGTRLDAVMPRSNPTNIRMLREFIRSGYRLVDAESDDRDAHGNVLHALNNIVGTVENGFVIRAWGTNRDITSRKVAEQALRESESRKDAILRSALDCVIIMDADGRIIDFNPAAERTFGFSAAKVRGKTVAETIIPPHLREAHWHGLRRYLETGERSVLGRRIEMPGRRADGSEIPIELTVTAARPHDGQIVFAAYLRDITDRLRASEALEQSEAQHRLLVEQVADHAIFLINPQRRAATWNRGVERVLGFVEEEFMGLAVEQLFTPEDRADNVPEIEFQTAEREGRASDNRWMLRKNGSRFWATGTTSALRDESGNLVGFSKIMRDQTDLKLAETELRAHREHLARLVDERTAELESSHRRLRFNERMAMLGTLAAGLGHDLGNLLLPMRVRLQSMEAKAAPGAIDDDLKAMRGITDYVQRLVNGLRLLASSGDIDGVAAQRTNLHTWWSDAEPIFKSVLPRGIRFEQDIAPNPPHVQLARPLLMQAVFNLLQNAAEALKDKPRPRVRVWARRPRPEDQWIEGSDNSLLLGITDNGPGMTPDVVQQCTEPAFSTKSGVGGLGLPIVKRIVEQVGGRLAVQSTPGEGTSFVLVLPAVADQPASPHAPHIETLQPSTQQQTTNLRST